METIDVQRKISSAELSQRTTNLAMSGGDVSTLKSPDEVARAWMSILCTTTEATLYSLLFRSYY